MALVAVGGAVGASLRWGIDQLAPGSGGFPWATLGINVTGAFVLALLPALPRVRTSAGALLLLGPGVLGGYTTLSAYAGETRDLLLDGRPMFAASYVVGTLLACLVAVALARRLTGPVPT